MTNKEKFWFFWLLALIALGILTGCKTKYVPVPEYHTSIVTQHDTLMHHDSIYEKDSVYMWMQGDTIWKEKVIIRYRDRIVGRTIYRDSIKVDSVRVLYPVERSLSRWERVKIYGKSGIVLAVIFFVILIFIKVIGRIRARR